MQRNEADVRKVMKVVRNWCDPFKPSDDLISPGLGYVAEESLECDLLGNNNNNNNINNKNNTSKVQRRKGVKRRSVLLQIVFTPRILASMRHCQSSI